jgi:aminoglycoside 3-N-acetyltransferase I
MKPETRRLYTSDKTLAVDIVKMFASENVSEEYMGSFLSNALNYLIIGEIDGEPAGFLLAHALQRLKQESHKMFIYEVDVAEQYRRKGVGTALIKHILKIVKEEKMMNAFVFTSYANEPAMALYKSTGGRIENGDDVMFVYD